MSNENHNSSPNWKSKLEEIESLPGETMPDKNAAWEKIHARLEGKSHERKPVWYWIAAATILFLFIIPFFISNKNNDQMAYRLEKQTQSKTKPNEADRHLTVKTVNPAKDSFTTENPVATKKTLTVIFNKSNETENKNIAGNKKEQARLSDTVNTQNQITETTNNSLPVKDTSSGLASIMPVKKRLPVVHVNELGEADDEPQVAGNSERPSVHFLKLGSEEVYNSPASRTKNLATINFKSSPN
jgi:hypothetical protein